MHTLLLLLASAQSAASDPAWYNPPPPPSRHCLRGRWSSCYERLGMTLSGVGFTYGRQKRIPTYNGPTPAYLLYFQDAPCPPTSAVPSQNGPRS